MNERAAGSTSPAARSAASASPSGERARQRWKSVAAASAASTPVHRKESRGDPYPHHARPGRRRARPDARARRPLHDRRRDDRRRVRPRRAPARAGALGAPLHTHRREDEYSYVLEGRLGVQLGEETLEAGPGELVFKPRGIPHAFWNAGDDPLRLLELISPAGFENSFREVAPVLAERGPDRRPSARWPHAGGSSWISTPCPASSNATACASPSGKRARLVTHPRRCFGMPKHRRRGCAPLDASDPVG